jgi:hypothetical protein
VNKVLKLALAGLVADRAVERVLDQQEFEHHPPRLNERRACGFDDHIISGWRGAGRRELAGGSLHLNQADPAGAEGM